jgi:hypothetical protein
VYALQPLGGIGSALRTGADWVPRSPPLGGPVKSLDVPQGSRRGFLSAASALAQQLNVGEGIGARGCGRYECAKQEPAAKLGEACLRAFTEYSVKSHVILVSMRSFPQRISRESDDLRRLPDQPVSNGQPLPRVTEIKIECDRLTEEQRGQAVQIDRVDALRRYEIAPHDKKNQKINADVDPFVRRGDWNQTSDRGAR